MTNTKTTLKEALCAWSPFILIFVLLVITSKAVPIVHNTLGAVKTSVRIYQGKGGSDTVFSWIVTPGILIFLAAIIGGKIQKASFKEIGGVFVASVKQMSKTVLTIASIMAAAKIMGYSGMIDSIASIIVSITGGLYPLVAPLIGSVGSFVTGSGTSSSVLFGGLQLHTAQTLNMDPTWLCAANSAGADAGKMISPQSIAIAIAAINKPGLESKIMSKAIRFYLLFVVLMGIICYAGLMLF